MENEGRIIELLSESLKTQDRIVQELKEINGKTAETNQRLYKLEANSEKVEEELIKLNLQTAENSRAILKMADKLVVVVDHERRISKLEHIIIK